MLGWHQKNIIKMKLNKIYTIDEMTVKYTGIDKAEVLSSKGPVEWYKVSPTSCTCPDFQIRKRGIGVCKHMSTVFSPKQIKFDKLNFKKGVEIDEAYEELGESEINKLLQFGEIIKMSRKFYLLN